MVARLQVQSCDDVAAAETWNAEQHVHEEEEEERGRSSRARDRYPARSSGDVDVSPLGRLVRETRGRLHATRDLWRLLPEQVCDELTVTTFDNSSLCWDGRSYR